MRPEKLKKFPIILKDTIIPSQKVLVIMMKNQRNQTVSSFNLD